jgi:hypothetical protein
MPNEYQDETGGLEVENCDKPSWCDETPKPAVVPVQKKNRLKEFVLDPSTGQFSMSRLCMGLVVMIFMPLYFLFAYWKVPVPASIIVSSLASLATVYGLNSAFGAFGRYRGMVREIERPLDEMTGANTVTRPGGRKIREIEGGE